MRNKLTSGSIVFKYFVFNLIVSTQNTLFQSDLLVQLLLFRTPFLAVMSYICKTDLFVTLYVPSGISWQHSWFFSYSKIHSVWTWLMRSHVFTISVLHNSSISPKIPLCTQPPTLHLATTYLFFISIILLFSRMSCKRWNCTICSLLSPASFWFQNSF